VVRALISGLIVVFVLAGCGPPPLKKPVRVCPGKDSLTQSLDTLRWQAASAVSVYARGKCRLRYWVDGKDRDPGFDVKAWVNPPGQVRLHGDIAFNARGLDLGANEDVFWLAIKPEISTYWWGKWSEKGRAGPMRIEPRLVLEAFGDIRVEDEQNWSLSNEGAFDVLTKREGADAITKRIYVHSCTYRVWRIEYFNGDGVIEVAGELYNYKKVAEGFFVPGVIKIIKSNHDGTEDTFKITLKKITPKEFTNKGREVIFGRPKSGGYKHVHTLMSGIWIEQGRDIEK